MSKMNELAIELNENAKKVKNEEKNGIELHFDNKPSAELLTYLKENGFKWNNKKRCWYANDNEKNNEITKDVKLIDRVEKQQKKEEKKEEKNEYGVKVGDVFYTSWGYEQTNLNFFQVIEVTKCTATIVEVVGKIKNEEHQNHMGRRVSFDSFEAVSRSIHIETGDETKKVKFIKHNKNASFYIHKNLATKYDGQELYESWGY